MKETLIYLPYVLDRINMINMIFLFFCPSRTEGQKPNAAKGGKRRLRGQTRDEYYGTP
ncbi:MAG: hypothetical protein JSW12_17090 [Deltaproteobacteria bacterium]|nr:MAG: hypothetical protein JSW12_17090 [Deltaproteobacteria bacterium]